MKPRFILFRRAGVFYCEDTVTKQQLSLRTKFDSEAQTLLHAKNESFRQPTLNRQIARTYLSATDPEAASRTWQVPMDEMAKHKSGKTLVRHERAMKDKAFDLIVRCRSLRRSRCTFCEFWKKGESQRMYSFDASIFRPRYELAPLAGPSKKAVAEGPF